MVEISTRLESYRTERGLTQRQMANRLGVSWRTYRGWINRPTGGPAVPLLERLLDEWEGRVQSLVAADGGKLGGTGEGRFVRGHPAQETDGRECTDMSLTPSQLHAMHWLPHNGSWHYGPARRNMVGDLERICDNNAFVERRTVIDRDKGESWREFRLTDAGRRILHIIP